MTPRGLAGSVGRLLQCQVMNDTEVRAYAVRGVTSRLAELDGERERLHELLASWSMEPAAVAAPGRKAMSEDARRRIGDAARKRWSDRRAAATDVVPPADTDTGVEAARVLPRRGRPLLPRQPTPPVPALPPMPRLVKHAS